MSAALRAPLNPLRPGALPRPALLLLFRLLRQLDRSKLLVWLGPHHLLDPALPGALRRVSRCKLVQGQAVSAPQSLWRRNARLPASSVLQPSPSGRPHGWQASLRAATRLARMVREMMASRSSSPRARTECKCSCKRFVWHGKTGDLAAWPDSEALWHGATVTGGDGASESDVGQPE